jgi:UDP-N-acetylmuramate dehydrogenase
MYETFQKQKPLKELCTLGIGGPCSYYIEVKEIAHMQKVIAFCKAENLAYFILGKGSNCLFDSRGLDRLVVHNKIDFCEEQEPGLYYVGAGFSFSLLGIQTARKGLSGLEFASGIPASVGGAVFMNAGAQGQATFDALQSVDFVEADGTLKRYTKEDLQYRYRFSIFQKMKGAIVAATFRLTPLSEARSRQLTLLNKRIETQPYQEKSAGCVFKNPEHASAGALIDKSGLKGFSVGGAKVSEMHANFLINGDQATSDDMLNLIDEVQKRVKEACGSTLEMEVLWITDQQ